MELWENLGGFFQRKGVGLIAGFFRGMEILGSSDQKREVAKIKDIVATL